MDRIDLRHVTHEPRQAWARGEPGDVDHAVFEIGQLITLDWYVSKTEAGTRMAWLAAGEQSAKKVIEQWINRRGGTGLWREIRPAR